jgi:hypothetical protein
MLLRAVVDMPMVMMPPQFSPAEEAHKEQRKRGHKISHKSKKPICVLDPHLFLRNRECAISSRRTSPKCLFGESATIICIPLNQQDLVLLSE